MALNINGIGNYNGKSFLGNSSAKPICGMFLRDLFRGSIYQAKVDTQSIVYPGLPVTIKNASTESAAGVGLNPNILSITNVSTADSEVSGFLLESPTDVMSWGEVAAHALKTQIVNVALLGSGVELYLPAGDDLANTQIGVNNLVWDFTNNCVKAATTQGGGYITGLSPVVDGVAFIANGDAVEFKDSKVIKVKL